MRTEQQRRTASGARGVMRDAYSVFRIPYSVSALNAIRNTKHGIRPSAFSLLELLVVVAIMGIVVTMGIPFVRTAVDGGKGMTRAVKDVQEACSHARALAILQQTTAELVIRPPDGIFEVSRSASVKESGHARDGEVEQPVSRSSGGGGGFSAKLPTGIVIEGLCVNGIDWTDDPVARVRFYPNGTSDEMSVVLVSDQNEHRNIWLEVVTGLPELETDPLKFKAR